LVTQSVLTGDEWALRFIQSRFNKQGACLVMGSFFLQKNNQSAVTIRQKFWSMHV